MLEQHLLLNAAVDRDLQTELKFFLKLKYRAAGEIFDTRSRSSRFGSLRKQPSHPSPPDVRHFALLKFEIHVDKMVHGNACFFFKEVTPCT